MLLVLLLVLADEVTTVRKCCPQESSLFISDEETSCLNSSHSWNYMNFTYGIPECQQYSYGIAKKGDRASCIDNRHGSDSIIALNCPTDDDKFSVPNVNYLSKCCPIERIYDSNLQTCSGDEKSSWPTEFFNVMMYNAEGVVDLGIGIPDCPRNQVLVDYLVLMKDIERLESASILFRSGGRQFVRNPDEVCLDRTERRDLFVIRACEEYEVACRKHTCIRKCCPEGESYFEELSTNCSPSNRPIRPMKVYKLGWRKEAVVSKSPAYWYGMDCPVGKYIDDKTDNFFLDISGSIYDSYGTKTERGLFCIENAYNSNESDYKDGDYVFFCFPEIDPINPSVHVWTTLGMMASCLFLFLTLVVYTCLPSLQNLHGKTLICHVSCLLAAYSALVTVHLITNQVLLQLCVVLGFFVQFTFLAAFFWLNVISFDIWWNFGSMRPVVDRRKRDLRRFCVYSIYAWSVPCLITVCSIIAETTDLLPLHLKPAIGFESCWFSHETYGNLLFFIGPEGVIVACNIIFFTLTARHCSQVKNELDKIGHTAIADKKFQSDKKKFVMNCKLFIVMGIGWALEFLSCFVAAPQEVWYLSDMANALQGLLIFTIFVLKKRVLDNLKRRFRGWCRKRQTRKNSVSTICTISNVSTHQLKKSISESRLSPLPMTKNPNVRTRSANRLLV